MHLVHRAGLPGLSDRASVVGNLRRLRRMPGGLPQVSKDCAARGSNQSDTSGLDMSAVDQELPLPARNAKFATSVEPFTGLEH
jgi:hypothetical protein